MNEETIDLSKLWLMIRKKIGLIIVLTLLITMFAGIFTFFFVEPEYRSTVAVFISDERKDAAASETINDINMYQKLVDTYAEIAKSRTVAEDVIKNLGEEMTVGELQSMISTSPKGNTQFLNLSVTSTDRELSYKMANQMARSLKVVSRELRGADIVQILDPANVPMSPSSPNVQLNLAIGFVLGMMISVFLVFILEFMDKTVKDPDFITNDLNLPLLAAIPLTEDPQ
ncbi:Wzz/FepE/Etk N-terminal domain-containing protein [Proteiniclasticum sp.]|uniref:YveK family protein n=1 Tax=Proteiniclasticum sp. TaxID=2053595 RepID=UPI00289DF94B|nr:Wzz/FepE/Etk N-terminal domain-containing protein [Proteiniclasticum sp.]